MISVCFFVFFFFRDKTAVKNESVVISFKSLFQDVRNAVDWVHLDVSILCKTSDWKNSEGYFFRENRFRKIRLSNNFQFSGRHETTHCGKFRRICTQG